MLWTPSAAWDVRGILTTERARDGDYGLNDLAALRANPFRAARDFEGYTHRDIVAPTLLVNRAGKTIDFSSTTGFVWWKTDDLTDLDYTPLPLLRRANAEDEPPVHAGVPGRLVEQRVASGCRPTSRCGGRRGCSSSRRATRRTP